MHREPQHPAPCQGRPYVRAAAVNNRFIDNIVGPTAPILGVVTSFQENIEYGLRVFSLVIGILIGLIHLYRALKRNG